MKHRLACCYAIATLITLPVGAQSPWTLRQCADYAVEHNINIKQRENNREQRELQLSTAKTHDCQTSTRRLPRVSASDAV